MEEDVGVKVAVTRLRRRLSVEQSEDGGSPAPSTPTKKRGGRLAAKPQLELIDENVLVSSPRKTRRQSLATETEEKPITPSRRSARIKSNSSIVSETLSVQATDSPRAKRAARRTSQAGSDNEGPATPVRQTRRTRKDSTSSIEQVCLPSPRRWPDIIGVAGPQEITLQLADNTSSHKDSGTQIKQLPVVDMVIAEEPENEVQKAANKSKSSPSAAEAKELSPNSARKSKRLLEKRNRRSGSYKSDQDSSTVSNKSLNISTTNKKAAPESQDSPSNKSVKSNQSNDDIPESNLSLLKKNDTESETNLSSHNKSALALDTSGNDKTKRNRTESWPAVAKSVEINIINYSDNEVSKKKKGKSDKNTSGLSVTDSPKIDKSNASINEKNTSHSFLDTSSKRKKKKSDLEDDSQPSENINELQVLRTKENSISSKEIASDQSDSDVTHDLAKLFANAPGKVQATIYYEDSDSNSGGATTCNQTEQHLDSEDQCVPVVKHDFQENLSPKKSGENDIVLTNLENVPSSDISISKIVSDDVNNSCEPMDIDETIHEEILQKSLDPLQQSNKSLQLSEHSIIEETNNSKRKSSISKSDTKTPDLSINNKRKSSISNSINTPDLSINNKIKSSISNSGTKTPVLSKKETEESSMADTSSLQPNKRKTSISSTGPNTPVKSENVNRKSSISNSTADTPDLSNNKSTLILSQNVSSTSENIKSPKATNEVLSKSDFDEKSKKNKKSSKGNLSLNDVKGTPTQNTIQKLKMQTSTPITTQQLGIKTKVEDQKHEATKKNKSTFSKSISATDSSEDSDCDDEPSIEKNKHIDDEAEEASDDYKSGDSQDEEDIRYEEENEIKERGETLTSDGDMSNDTDYEKDSFVVSSDEEDRDLLSGSGDDLSMSDNELTMSKKSKKKFNERKLKEQKNASREMFESRHKLNTSEQESPNLKTKKNRMRIDSSLLESDEEVVVNPKKSNRMRLDSTVNESVQLEETNVSLNKSNNNKSKQSSALVISGRQEDTNKSPKKNKSMQDSICNKSAIDEKEITVCNESTISNADPLQVLVKQEPKTPQKDLSMSVVQFTDREEIENVQITEGNSIMNQSGTDPLQNTMAQDDYDSSECEELLQSYDSVLNKLNKDNKTKFNKNNVSLNSGYKTKKNYVEPIIDQLNLTHTKNSKNNRNKGDVSNSKTVKASKQTQASDTDSSASIDLQLLFSEDNCGSDDEQKSQDKPDDDNMFIPLKRTPAKTNIQESIGMDTSQQDATLNEFIKKKKNRKSSLGPAETLDDEELNVSLNESGMKKKKKHSISEAALEESQDVNASKISTSINESGIKKKKKHSISEAAEEESQDTLNVSKNVNISLNESGKKKKKKHSLSESAEVPQDTLNVSKNVNISLNESGMKKKKKHSVSEPGVEESQDSLNVSKNINISLNESGMKKKKTHSTSEPTVEESQDTLDVSKNVNISLNEIGKKKKKKHSTSESAVEETQDTLNVSKNVKICLNESGMKKKKKSPELENQDSLNVSKNVDISLNESGMKKKKKHSTSELAVEESQGNADAVETELNENTKKKKKRKTSLAAEPEDEQLFFIDTTGTLPDNKDAFGELNELPLYILFENKKKKKVGIKNNQNETEQIENTTEESNPPVTPKSEKKKKKQKMEKLENTIVESNPAIIPKSEKNKQKQKLEEIVQGEDSDGAPEEAPYQSEKASEIDLQNTVIVSESADMAKKKHKKKKKKQTASVSNQSGENIDTEDTIPSNLKKRKRKSSYAENTQESEDAQESVEIGKHNELVGSNKKRKISHNEDNTSGSNESKNTKKNKKKHRDLNFQDTKSTSETIETQVKKNKKRKHRDDDGDNKQTKVKKDSSFQEVHVPRLPDSILRQLDDKPRKIEPPKVISTSNFVVENARQKRAKPSNYLEESIYLDEKSPHTKKQKQRIKKPKVLPFIPTASISDSGYTTNFKINKLSQTTTFEAEPVAFCKEAYLQKNNIKRLGTYDRYKKQMHHKMSKF